MDAPARRARLSAAGRPYEDRACAGCLHLPLLRALRRAGLGVEGALGCEDGTPWAQARRPDGPGAWRARLSPAAGALDPALWREVALAAVADRGDTAASAALGREVAFAGGRPFVLPADASAAEAEALVAVARASGPGAVVIALAPCAALALRRPAFQIVERRCLRCGACLALGCAAILDRGGEALHLEPETCVGCGLCAPLCRSRAIVPG